MIKKILEPTKEPVVFPMSSKEFSLSTGIDIYTQCGGIGKKFIYRFV